MPTANIEKLRAIKTFPSLLKYLTDELEWPIETENIEELTFEYTPTELGLGAEYADIIKEIKQLRPLAGNQPWGIFFINFEKKRLPVVVMRRILRSLVFRKRASANKADRQAWHASDLLFISAYGEEKDRAITLAHFVERPDYGNLAELRVLGWDDDDTPLKYEYIAQTLHDKLRWNDSFQTNQNAWRKNWREAFVLRHREVIQTSQELALAMAHLAKRIRSRVRSVLRLEDGFGEVRKLQRAFRAALIHDLSDDDFADMWAQTITYGLFSAAVSRPAGIHSGNLVDMVPVTNPFLRDMLGTFLKISGRQGTIDFDELGIQEVVDLLNSDDTHLDAVLRDFGKKNPKEDPVIHFYQNFLNEYDKVRRIQRGVFYTPQPVVSYIVRSTHELLQTEFGLEDGLADITTWGEMVKRNPGMKLPPRTDEPGEKRTIDPSEPFVVILDIATGTSTFIVEVIDVIHKTMLAKWKKAGKTDAQIQDLWNDYVPKYLLPRVYGFELMMAPYAIAHMKVGLKLTETSYKFRSNERARIYLTNTLEPKVKQLPQIGFEALANEAKEVNEVKWYKRFTVVMGNPPYSISSSNKGEFIEKLMELYKQSVRAERNIQPLSDDYIKFIRVTHEQIATTGLGVAGLITNHAYLSGVIHRGVRESLFAAFNRITVLDLHGNTTALEASPEGVDVNVFDIQQGVSISFWGKVPQSINPQPARFAELWGSREDKYGALSSQSIQTTKWEAIRPHTPYFFFVPKDFGAQEEYDKGWQLPAIFPTSTSGVTTHRDHFFVGFSEAEVRGRVKKFTDGGLTDANVAVAFDLEDWDFKKDRARVMKQEKSANPIVPYSYRPFDERAIFYSTDLIERHRYEVMRHMLAPNLGFCFMRKPIPPQFNQCMVTRSAIDKNFYGYQTYVFPLFLHDEDKPTQGALPVSDSRRLNISPDFIKSWSTTLGVRWASSGPTDCIKTTGPMDVFHYAYAVFHSPGYRTRYAEFLKIDFPRLPLTARLDLFRALAALGGDLVALHLLESPQLDHPITRFIGNPKQEIEKVTYADKTVWIDKAQTTGFKGVPDLVWNFHIGGYQVCEKWLKDRKTRTLTKDEIAHYQKVVVALTETIRLMSEIDKVIEKHGGWPIK